MSACSAPLTADRWRTGDLAARTDLPGDNSEYGRLAAAFDGMAAALDARERALRTSLESTTDGVVALDNDWRFTYLNAHAKRLIARGNDLLGRVVWEAFPGLAGTEFGDAYRAAMEHGRPTHAKGYYAPLDGYFEARIFPSEDGVTVFYHDVSEERRIAAALAGSETRLRLAQEAAGFGIWEYDGATGAITWSPEQFRLHGLDPAAGEPSFEQWLDLVEPEDRAAVIRATADVESASAAVLRLEFRIRRASDGEVRWLEAIARLVAGEAPGTSRVVGINLDVTDRRQAEDALLQATALLHAIGDCSPDPIYAKDSGGRFLFANPALLAVIGRPANEVIGRTDADWHSHPEQAAAVMANDRRIIETGQTEFVEEVFDAAGLGTRVFQSAKAPLRMGDGRAVGVVCVSSDITRAKNTEAELRRLTGDLENRVHAEVAAREAAQARAAHAERMHVLGQLAGGIAHDFNNVLQALDGAVTLMARDAEDPVRVRRVARLALEATSRGASITRRLLAFGRRGDLRSEPADPAKLLAGLRDMVAHTMGAGVTVDITAEPGIPPILVDKAQLETAILNLVTNARDAMPDGGSLTLSAAAENVADGQVAGMAAGRYVRITVADNGTGMDPPTVARATEPFFTTKPPGAGTGLGLSMAKGFAEQSGGGLSIASQPGCGTAVSVWLPQVGSSRDSSGPAASVRESEAAVLATVPPLRVLLVDDDALLREVLAEDLAHEGCTVVAAGGGAEALALLAAGEPADVLVTDLAMPGMNGLALIEHAQECRHDLPAVLLTGYAGDGAALKAPVTGHYLLLRKPIHSHELVGHIMALLEAARVPPAT